MIESVILKTKLTEADFYWHNLYQMFYKTVKADFVGKHAFIPAGQYKGRIGLVEGVTLSDKGVLLLIRPYRKTSTGTYDFTDLLNDRPDARTYWPIKNVEFVDQVE